MKFCKTYQERGLPAEVHAFIDDMPGALAQADLVISRAGATAVAELAAAGRAAVLIPFPGAADQHQLENARAMEKAGAARVIVQSELTPERLVEEIRELMGNPAKLERWNPRTPSGQARRGRAHCGLGGSVGEEIVGTPGVLRRGGPRSRPWPTFEGCHYRPDSRISDYGQLTDARQDSQDPFRRHWRHRDERHRGGVAESGLSSFRLRPESHAGHRALGESGSAGV